MRKAYVRIKLPEEIVDYVAYVVNNRLLGYRSMIEFVASATRKEVQRLRQLGFVPPVVPKVRDVPTAAIGSLAAVVLVALIGLWTLLPSGLTGMGVLDDVFSPLADWDIAGVYARYQGFISVTLYFMAFFAITFSVTKRWLDRREAVILSSVFAVALALGLAMVPADWIRQVSPVALLVLVLILFYVVLEALRHLGFAWVSSGSIAYILAYLLVRTHRPDIFVAAGSFGTALNLAFLIAFFVALYKIIAELWKRSETGFVKVGHAARLAWGDTFSSPAERALLLEEEEGLTQLLKIQPQEYKALRQVEADLANAEQAIRKYGYSKQALEGIAHELTKLREQESELTKKLEALHSLAERLQRLDLELFTKLKDRFDKLPSRERKTVKKAIEEKVTELNLEAALPRLVEAAQQAQAHVTAALNNVIENLERAQAHDALQWLDRTRYYVAQLRELLKQAEDMERAIQALLGKSLSFFRP